MPSTIEQAVKAELPLIAVSTKDRSNAPAVIHRLTGEEPNALPTGKGLPQISPGQLYHTGAKTLEARGYGYSELYAVFATAHASLIVYNLKEVPPEFFDAGELPTPPDLVRDVLANAIGKEAAEELIPSFGGLTLKEVTEIFRLTKVRDGRVTPRGVAATRKALFRPAQGLQLVDTSVPLYWPQSELHDYAGSDNEWFFLHDDKNPRLRPRGVLLKGDSGVGKTTFAKWLANKWGVPLFRLNVGFHNKYVGESARLFSSLLDQVNQQAPCLVLGTLVETVEGPVPVEQLESRGLPKLIGVDPETGLPCTVDLFCVIKREGKPTLKISTATSSVEVTEDHKLLCRRPEGLVWVEAKDLRPGDDLVEFNE